MKQAMIWILSFSVLGPAPHYQEIPKFTSREQCQAALQQKREEYRAQGQRIVGSCVQSTQSAPTQNTTVPAH